MIASESKPIAVGCSDIALEETAANLIYLPRRPWGSCRRGSHGPGPVRVVVVYPHHVPLILGQATAIGLWVSRARTTLQLGSLSIDTCKLHTQMPTRSQSSAHIERCIYALHVNTPMLERVQRCCCTFWLLKRDCVFVGTMKGSGKVLRPYVWDSVRGQRQPQWRPVMPRYMRCDEYCA